MTHEELLKQARAHWIECSEHPAETENRERGREDARFAAGEQWRPEDARERRLEDRPWLTFNRLPAFLHQLENEVRRNPVAIKIAAVDDGIDKDTAAVDQGLVRQIQRDSRADSAAHAAFVEACRTGLGAFALRSRRVGPDTLDQELHIEQIPNAISRLWWDPFAELPDRSDMRYAFEVARVDKETFQRDFPGSEISAGNFEGGDSGYDGWINESGVRLAHYYYVAKRKRKLLCLSTGKTVFADEAGELPPEIAVLREADTETSTVKCATINGAEVLEETEWPGSTIPIFPVLGEETWVDGRLARFSLIHSAIDSQRLLNFYRSSEAELIGLAPKAPWIMAEGQDEGHEEQWRTANRRAYSSLKYNPKTIGGQVIGPPQRNAFEPAIQSLSAGAAQVIDEMKAGIGMYDASLGAKSNETSGIAIQRRQAEGDLANFHFLDNYGRAWCACGRAIVEAKPFYYDTPRTILIMGEDERQRVVRVNQQYVDEGGRPRHYRLSDTKYNVTISTGPSYTTMRQEAWTQLTELARAYPQLMAAAGHIIMRKSDIPGADEIAEQLKKLLPPNLAGDGENGGGPQPGAIPPQAQAEMQALMQQHEQLTAALNKANEEARGKRLELDSRERIATMQEETKRTVALAQIDSREGIELLRQEIAALAAKMPSISAQGAGELPRQEVQ
jgi:hypothetical protein